MSERLFPLNTPTGTIEYLKGSIPRLPELVEFWGNHLEFWAQSGGMDNITSEELERAHIDAQRKAEEMLRHLDTDDVYIADAYSNMALHAAQLIREQSLKATPEEIHV